MGPSQGPLISPPRAGSRAFGCWDPGAADRGPRGLRERVGLLDGMVSGLPSIEMRSGGFGTGRRLLVAGAHRIGPTGCPHLLPAGRGSRLPACPARRRSNDAWLGDLGSSSNRPETPYRLRTARAGITHRWSNPASDDVPSKVIAGFSLPGSTCRRAPLTRPSTTKSTREDGHDDRLLAALAASARCAADG